MISQRIKIKLPNPGQERKLPSELKGSIERTQEKHSTQKCEVLSSEFIVYRRNAFISNVKYQACKV